jgi:glycolate oxidase
VTVQPGITLAELDRHLERLGVSLNQEQGSYRTATVGGSISTSGFSRRHQKYGTIANRVMSLEVVLADGSVLRTGKKVLYTSTGYRLQDLFIGAEGTLGIITEATLRVEPLPEAKDAMLAFYDGFWEATVAAQKLMNSPVTFVGAEAYETDDATRYGAPPDKIGIFYVLLDGTKGEVAAEKSYIERIVEETGGVLASNEVGMSLFSRYVSQFCGARAVTGSEDVITSYVPMDRMKEYYDEIWNSIMPRYGISPLPGDALTLDVGRYRMQGARFFLPKGEREWEIYREVIREVAKLTTSLGGTISSCHGVGIEHRDNLVLEFSEVALDVMRALKKALDPDGIMNPGKKLPP